MPLTKGFMEAYKDTPEISFNNRKILQGGEINMCYITCCPNTLGNFWQIFKEIALASLYKLT
jgi:hypothetical protein